MSADGLDIDAAYPLPDSVFSGQSLHEQLIDRAEVTQRLALHAANSLARHYYLGAARGFRQALELLPAVEDQAEAERICGALTTLTAQHEQVWTAIDRLASAIDARVDGDAP